MLFVLGVGGGRCSIPNGRKRGWVSRLGWQDWNSTCAIDHRLQKLMDFGRSGTSEPGRTRKSSGSCPSPRLWRGWVHTELPQQVRRVLPPPHLLFHLELRRLGTVWLGITCQVEEVHCPEAPSCVYLQFCSGVYLFLVVSDFST